MILPSTIMGRGGTCDRLSVCTFTPYIVCDARPSLIPLFLCWDHPNYPHMISATPKSLLVNYLSSPPTCYSRSEWCHFPSFTHTHKHTHLLSFIVTLFPSCGWQHRFVRPVVTYLLYLCPGGFILRKLPVFEVRIYSCPADTDSTDAVYVVWSISNSSSCNTSSNAGCFIHWSEHSAALSSTGWLDTFRHWLRR